MDSGGSYNGLTWGAGQALRLAGLVGVDAPPPYRYTATQIAGRDGGYYTGTYLADRIVDLHLRLRPVGADAATQRANYDALIAAVANAFAPQASALPLALDGGKKLVYCRPTKADIPRDPRDLGRIGLAAVELTAIDPLIYDATQGSLSTGLANTAGGGFGYPFGFPWGYGTASASSGTVVATNAGKKALAPCQLVIHGPCANPVVENLTTSRVLAFNATLAANETITLDTRAETVIYSGQAARYDLLKTDDWWQLAPGANSIRFRADAYLAGAYLEVFWRSAYLTIGG